MDEEERGILDRLAAAVNVRSLVGRQVLDESLPQVRKKRSTVGLSAGFFG
ncbi:hypothetical protein [Streptomyces sp. NPDC004976]